VVISNSSITCGKKEPLMFQKTLNVPKEGTFRVSKETNVVVERR